MSQTPSCRTCGASLAPDQRYCLSCGTRAAAPRLDFLAESARAEAEGRANGTAAGADAGVGVGATAAAGPQPSAAAAPPSRLDKVGGPMGVAAAVLVALGAGFLVGQLRGESQPAQTVPAPVVKLEGALPGGATVPAAPAVDGASAPPAETTETGATTPAETTAPAAPPADAEPAGDADAETVG